MEDSSKKPLPSINGFNRFRKEWLEPILFALIVAGLIRIFIMQPFRIPSGSMEDTLLVGDQLMASKFTYGLRLPYIGFIWRYNDPEPGEVVVFKYPDDPSKDYIKRVIAVGGQEVEIINKQVFVDGIQTPLPGDAKYIDNRIYPASMSMRDNFGPVTVPEGHMFMLGDNRDNSNDSRFWSFVPYDNIVGKAFIIWWSWDSEEPFYALSRTVRWNRLFSIIR